MKINIHIKLALYSSLILFTACELDRAPEGQLSSSNYWTSQNDVELALMGCYEYLDADVYGAYTDGYVDNEYCQYPWESNATNISAGNITDDMNDGYNFRGIRRFNYFLDNVGQVEMDNTLKNQYIAEVRTLRALRYFNMANKFGPTPLFKNYIEDAENARITPTAEADIITFCIKELEESIPNLPQNQTYKSRISRAAALAIKARIHLTYSEWQEAATEAAKIIDMQTYDLFKVTALSNDDYLDDYAPFIDFANNQEKENFYKGLRSYEKLFWDENKNNVEVILNSEFIENRFNYISLYFLPDNAGGGWSSITPTLELVNAYWNQDGSEFTPPSTNDRVTNYNNGSYNSQYLEEFKNRDTRLYASILYPGAVWNALMGNQTFVWQNNGNGSNLSKTGYNFRKLVDPNNNIWRKVNDFPLIRYAEVLLTYAEAENEANGPSTKVFDALDKIRERVAMPSID